MELAFTPSKSPKYKNQVLIIVVGDSNDGDYIRELSILKIKDFNEIYPYMDDLLPAATGDRRNSDDEDETIEVPKKIKNLFENCIRIPSGEYGCSDISYEEIIYFDENGVGRSV